VAVGAGPSRAGVVEPEAGSDTPPTVGIGAAKNAGILAAQIIGSGDVDVRAKVAAYKEKMAKGISAKDAELQEKGFKKYLEDKGLI